MIEISLLILGCGSALPTVNSNQTSQLFSIGSQSFLIDCGEGTQIELRRNKVKIQQISRIFISHLHGDHYFGLVGLLSTMHLLGRTKPIEIHAPVGLEEIVRLQFRNGSSNLSFKVNFYEIVDSNEVLFDNEFVKVSSLPLNHRIPCYGFLFQEKHSLKKLRVEALEKYRIPKHARKSIAEGMDYTDGNGKLVPNKELTHDPLPLRSYAYCSDTAYCEDLIDSLPPVNLLYHEATFLESDKERATITYHSTAKSAAKVAQMTGAERLLMGHISNRYKNSSEFENEARQVFPESYLAEEGVKYEL